MNTDEPTPTMDPAAAPEAVPAPQEHPSLSTTPPDATAEQPPDGEASPIERLEALAARAALARLRADEEDEAAHILQAHLAAGGVALGTALTFLTRFNWNVTVNALNAAWPEMSATAKDTLVSGLKRDEFRTEAARRVRLSLARGLFKQDAEAAAKIIGGVCAELRKVSDEEPLTKSERRNFDSVMIGKGRPWICQLPLAEWRAAESNPAVQVAIAVCFSGNVPPFSQLSMLKWLAEGGRLEKLADESLALICESIARWSGKWKSALVREVTPLPEAIAAAAAVPEPARPPEPQPAPRPAAVAVEEDETEEDEEDEDEADEVEEDAADDEEEDDDDDEDDASDEEDDDEEEDDDDDAEEEEGEESAEASEGESGDPVGGSAAPRISRRERFRQRRQQRAEARAAAASGRIAPAPRGESPERSGENGGRGGAARTPDFREALRLVERHYQTLKTELDVARANLRQRPGGGGKRRRDFEQEPDMPESEQAALRQHNQRLEATVAELRERIEGLTAAAEDEATSREAFGDGAAPGEKEQFQTLLGLKLARAKADYEATHGRLRDDVFGDNYRTMLENVFGILSENGIVFPKPEEPVEPTPV